MNQYEALLRQGPNEAASGSTGPAVGANLGRAGKIGASVIGTAAGLAGYGSPELGLGLGFAGDLASGKSLGRSTVDTGFNAVGAFGGLAGQVANLGYDVATAKDPTKSALSTAASMTGGLFGGPVGSMVGGALASAAYSSFKDGVLGDVTDTRSNEFGRDVAENQGFSRSQSAGMAGVDAGRDSFSGSGYGGIDPGVGGSGYGLSPGLSDVNTYGGYNLGTDIDTAFGQAAYGGYSDNDGGGSGSGSSDSSSSGSGIGGVSGADLGKGGEAW